MGALAAVGGLTAVGGLAHFTCILIMVGGLAAGGTCCAILGGGTCCAPNLYALRHITIFALKHNKYFRGRLYLNDDIRSI